MNRPTRTSSPGRPSGPRAGYGSQAPRQGPNPNPRKRMMAQGRKGHFMHDAKLVLMGPEGMDDQNVRAFLESVFQRGTRQSTEQAIEFIGEKFKEGAMTRDQANDLADLVDKYSFWR